LYETIVRPVPGVDPDALKFTTCSASGVTGENVNDATVSTRIEVVVVDVEVVVSVIFTTPGPTGVLLWQASARTRSNGLVSSSFRITYIVRLRPTTGVTVECRPLFFMVMIAFSVKSSLPLRLTFRPGTSKALRMPSDRATSD
jgi:hypothetical protein